MSASALPQSSPTKIPILKLQCLLQQGKIVAATGERQNAPGPAIDNGRVECGRFQISLSDDECRGATCLYRRDTSAKRSRRISYFSSQLVHHRRLGAPRPRGRESQRNQAGAGGPLIVEPEPELKGHGQLAARSPLGALLFLCVELAISTIVRPIAGTSLL